MSVPIGILAGIVGLIAAVVGFVSIVLKDRGDNEVANILKWIAIALAVVFILMTFLE